MDENDDESEEDGDDDDELSWNPSMSRSKARLIAVQKKKKKKMRQQVKKLYQCTKCDFSHEFREIIRLHDLAFHRRLIFEDEPVKCSFCDESFKQLHEMLDHLPAKHPEKKDAKLSASLVSKRCQYFKCEYVASNEKTLQKHFKAAHMIENGFVCPHCAWSFATKKNLNRHINMKHVINEGDGVQCPHCENRYTNKMSLGYHIKAKHSRNYQCPECKAQVGGNFKSLEAHVRRCCPDQLERVTNDRETGAGFRCEECDAVFPSRLALRCHTAKHQMEKCPGCSAFKTLSRKKMSAHVKTCCPDKMDQVAEMKLRDYKCAECDFSCDTAKQLRRHTIRHHETDKEELKCDKCEDFVAKTKHKLDLHKEKKHGIKREKSIFCEICGFATFTAASLIAHIVQKHEKKATPCKQCDFVANSQPELNQHKAEVHPEEKVGDLILTCEWCGSSARGKLALLRHQVKYHARELGEIRCSRCDQVQKSGEELENHMATKHNMGRKTFNCEQCEFRALNNKVLRDHVKTTHEIRMYPCEQCDYRAKVRQALKQHVKRVHEKMQVDPAVHKCAKCAYSTSVEAWLTMHIAQEHPEIKEEDQSSQHSDTVLYVQQQQQQQQQHIQQQIQVQQQSQTHHQQQQQQPHQIIYQWSDNLSTLFQYTQQFQS